jgi:predicted HTH domain antitoxin
MSTRRVRVVLIVLVNLINRRGRVSFSDAAKMLDLDENSLSQFLKILVDYKILEIEYSADGDRVLKKGDAIESTIIPKEIREKVEAALDAEKIEERDISKKAEVLIDVAVKKKGDDELSL